MQIVVLGAGSMGNGIAQVSAMAGPNVTLRDIEIDFVEDGLKGIRSNLAVGVERGKVSKTEMEETRIDGTTDLEALRRKVRADNLGKKTGEEFYVWEDGECVGMTGKWGKDDE